MKNGIGFFLGLVSFCFLTDVPDLAYFYWLAASALLWFLLPPLRWVSSFSLGFLWIGLAAQTLLTQHLPDELIGKDVTVTGVITTLPEVQDNRTRFVLQLKHLDYQGRRYDSPKKIRLSWYANPPQLVAGETWQLNVRLKPARGLANPGGFDYERWLFENRITATGYVKDLGQSQRLSEAPWYNINTWRQAIRQNLLAHYGDGSHVSLVNALLLGDQSLISDEQWDVLRATGTNHLLAISGMQISLVAGFSFWIFQFIFKQSGRVLLKIPAFKLALIPALISALIYAALAGFSIPTQRALVMLLVVFAFLLFDRRLSALRVLTATLLAVLIYDPLSVLSVSFWLSFAAVFIIIYSVQGRVKPEGWWWKWGRLQWAISLAMIPMILFIFENFSVVSPIANFFAVPWVSFFIVPLVFIAGLISWFDSGFELLLKLTDFTLEILWWVLEKFAMLPMAQWFGYIDGIAVLLLALLGVALILAPRGLPVKIPGITLFLPALFYVGEKLPEGSFKLTLLDVGQGLGAVIETRDHLLVYDTGAKFGDSFDMGESVLVPFLRTLQKKQIDKLVISHGDNDHIGGMQSLLARYQVNAILSGVMDKTPYAMALPCTSQQHWQWNAVQFDVLHPEPDSEVKGNNGSCVIKVSNRYGSVLLTGDIEKDAEHKLLEKNVLELNSDVLIAPHHGSKTSSTEAFIKAVSPQWVLFPSGYQNRFGFPRPEIVERYQRLNVPMLITGNEGAISFSFFSNAQATVNSYRRTNKNFWNLGVD